MSTLANAVAAVQVDVVAIQGATIAQLPAAVAKLELDVTALAKLINSVIVLITDQGLEVLTDSGQPMVIS